MKDTHMNFADRDPALRPLLDALLSPADRERVEPHIAELGEVAATELDELATTADANGPTLRQFAPDGTRIDEVVYHPAYTRMHEIAYSKYGLAAMSHRPGVLGWETRVPHVVKYALSYLYVQSEFGLACPLSMTDSAARILRLFDPEGFPEEIAALSSTDMSSAATGAMFMTEKQAGTDIGKTDTVATDHGTHWTLTGHKWFCSNVSADVILTLAQVPGQGEGTRGLGMFMLPRLRPDGSRNSYTIERLKNKLGTRSMASGEVRLDEAYARPVGDLTKGFPQMAEMLNVSRLSNAMRATALMRRAVTESIDHTRQRIVFGRSLFDAPLMRATMLPMLLDTEAALGLVLEAADRLDAADAADVRLDATASGDTEALRLIRILTPLAKYTVCKQARQVTGEAMEIRGGNGYIEDFVNARLVRDAYLGSIWEGSSNVIALDVLRCMKKEAGHVTVAQTYLGRLEALDSPDVKAGAQILTQRWESLLDTGNALLKLGDDDMQIAIAEYARDLAHTIMATLLFEQAARDLDNGLGYRKLLIANTYLHRLVAGRSVTPAPALGALEQIADGGDVAREVAQAAFDAIDPDFAERK